MREGQGEFGIAHQDRAGGLAFDLDRARGESVEIRREIEIHDVQSLLQTFHQEFRLSGFAGIQPADVVGGPGDTVGPRSDDREDGLDDFVGADAREAERIVTRRIVIRAGDLVRTGREDQTGLDVEHGEPGPRGRGVFGEDLNAEELVEVTEIPWNHHQRRDGRDLQRQILVFEIDFLEINSLDLDVQAGGLQLRGEFGAGGDLLVDGLRPGQLCLEFGRGNDFRGLLERRGHHWKSHRDGLAVEDECDLELDRVKILFIEDVTCETSTSSKTWIGTLFGVPSIRVAPVAASTNRTLSSW